MAKQVFFRFQILKSKAKQPYHWICIASNGEIRCTSENYTQKASARNAIRSWIKYMKPGVAQMEDHTGESKRR